MNFSELAKNRQSCRRYDPCRTVEEEKLQRIIDSAILAPSACNGQPYRITVCTGESAKTVRKCVTGMGMNSFVKDVSVFFVISEEPYVASAALGAKVKKNDYRSIDIGILASYVTLEATAQGLGTCIIGWLDDAALRSLCGDCGTVRLVIALGYAKEDDPIREKKRKSQKELVRRVD